MAEHVLDLEAVADSMGEMEGKYLTFWSDGQLFGLSIANVVQIVGMQEITPLPDLPDYAKGVINLRGAMIPVVDVRLRFGKAERAYDERTCIIVLNLREQDFGFIVDEVDEVTDIAPSAVSQPPPRVTGREENQYLTGVAQHGDRIVLLMDAAHILGTDDFSRLAEAGRS